MGSEFPRGCGHDPQFKLRTGFPTVNIETLWVYPDADDTNRYVLLHNLSAKHAPVSRNNAACRNCNDCA